MDGHSIRVRSPDGGGLDDGRVDAHGSKRGRLPGVPPQPLALSVTKDGDLLVCGVGWIAQMTR